MAYLHRIGLGPAPYRLAQSDILGFMLETVPFAEGDRTRVEKLYAHAGIGFRHSVLKDFAASAEHRAFYRAGHTVPVNARMDRYMKDALPMAVTASMEALGQMPAEQITHLITVSCTGLAAPGLDVLLVRALGLKPSIQRLAVNFMGCYAMVPALRQAQALCALQPDARVLVVGVELCTLHFQPIPSLEQATASLLFGDGAAAALVCSEPGPFKLGVSRSALALKGEEDMAWQIEPEGFLMRLSAYVPDLLGEAMKELLQTSGFGDASVEHWALHPGGRKILQACASALMLEPDALQVSRSILHDYGNMSSVTLLYVLHRMLQAELKGAVCAASFGPGLSLETLMLHPC